MKVHYCPPLNLLWSFLPGDGSPASVIHQCYTREVWRERGFWARLGLLAAFLIWLPAVVSMIAWFTLRNGLAIQQRSGRGIPGQILDQLRMAAVHAVWPPWYYVFELYDAEKRGKAAQYINKHEMNRNLYAFLHEHLEPPKTSPLRNKALFAERCGRLGLPVVPVLVIFDPNGFRRVMGFEPEGGAPASLPEIDLFAKPIDDMSGRGAERWCHVGAGRYRGGDGRVLNAAELIEHLKALCRKRHGKPSYVIQPRVLNHPELADLSNGVLSTVRLLTCRDENGGFECTHAVFKMASATTAVVDNFHAGGIATRVDLANGELGRAVDLGFSPGLGWCEVHPISGVRIEGRKIPMWPEILDLARRAHEAFSDRTLIGWDIALLADGPVLLEAQARSDLDFIQRTHGQGLAETRLGELLAFHVRRAQEARGRARASPRVAA